MVLAELGAGKRAVIKDVGGDGALRQHLLDMGMIPGIPVTTVKFAPMGDPMEVLVHGYTLTLRLSEARLIGVQALPDGASPEKAEAPKLEKVPHPGFGEGGKFHPKGSGDPLPVY